MRVNGKKSVAALAALALMTATTAFADRGGGEHGGAVSNKTLNGTYIMEGGGFDLNDATSVPSHTGDVEVLGIANFDGNGGFTGTFTFTSADSGGDQASCVETLSGTDGTYAINTTGTPGAGTLAFKFDSSSTKSSGSMNFLLVVPSADGKGARLLENDNGAFGALTICGEPISTLSLKAHLRKAIQNND
jgi:hypothetical protein